MVVKSKVPQIRFKGLIREWDSKKLGEIANFSKGQGYSKNDLVEVGKSILLYGRLYTKYQTVISIVDTFVKEKNNSIFSKGNEVVVPASGETAEDIARASAINISDLLIGGDLNIIYPNNKINNIFLALNISNGKTQKDLSNKAQGKSVVHLRNNDLKEIDLIYPETIEQTKIGNYFQKLDKLIEQKQIKQQKLIQFKKAMLDKMFPKNGANTPEIRFKGFGVEWEEKSLGELCSISTGKLDANAMVQDGKYRFYTCAKEYLRINNYAFNTDALIVSGNGANVGYIHYYKGKFNAYQRTYVLDKFLDDIIFIKYILDRYLHQRILIEKNEGNMPYIVLGTLADMAIMLPFSLKEQTKIGNYFKKLDYQIDLQLQELEKLKNIKKASLDKMFV